MIAGVDGCKGGWIAVLDDEAGGTHVELYPTFRALLDCAARLIVIDVPIGLMDATPRMADGAARKLLGRRACCVFSAPYRPMLRAASRQEACAIREGIDGKRCTQQAYGIIDKIRDVDALMNPEMQQRVHEGHPEVTFAIMNGAPMAEGKKSRLGRAARLAALTPFFSEIETYLARPPRGVGRDDIIDAFAMLWTARRVVTNASLGLPDSEQRDSRGLVAQIIA